MRNTYFGFALADSMFQGICVIDRQPLSVEAVRQIVRDGVESCLNPSHEATVGAMRQRFDIDVSIPEAPPHITLNEGDRMLVMGVRGLHRLTDRHHYSAAEIETATFSFSLYTVRIMVVPPAVEGESAMIDLCQENRSALED